MRSHVDLSMDQRIRIEESLIVDCDPLGRLGRNRGCGRLVGERCVNLATGLPLEGLGAHVGRLLRARAHRPGPSATSTSSATPSSESSEPPSVPRPRAEALAV